MGFLSSLAGNIPGRAPAPLQPSPHPLGVIPFFTQHNHEIALRVREKKFSLSGDDFEVKDAYTGQTMFVVEGKTFSLRDDKVIMDARHQPLFTIKHKILSIHSTYLGIHPTNSSTLFTVKSGLSLGTKLTASFRNLAGGAGGVGAGGVGGVGGEEELVLRGDLLDRSAEILWRGRVVARISREFMNMGQVFSDKQTYFLTIAPGVDAALLLAICICLDEKANEGKK